MLFDGFDFAPPGDLLSLLVDRHPVQRKLGKETPPDIQVSLRETSLAPALLRRHAPKGRPVPSELSRRPASNPAAQHLHSAF